MKFAFKLLALLICCHAAKAQSISPTKLIKHTIDSLKHIQADTIIYYHTYCSECGVGGRDQPCIFSAEGFTEISNIILYKQFGKYYSIHHNCENQVVKTQLLAPQSMEYFLSIIPSLNKRDKFINELYHQKKFLPPIPTDGMSYEAFIYCKNIKQGIFMHSAQMSNYYYMWKKFFWINEEIKVLNLLKKDLF